MLTNERLKTTLQIFIILVIICWIISLIIGPSKDLNSQLIKKEKYQGIVVKKYLDSTNHNNNTILLRNGEREEIHWKLALEIEVGDSLSKKENEIYTEIFRKGEPKITVNLLTFKK